MKVDKKTFSLSGEDEKCNNRLHIEEIVPETSQSKEEKISHSFCSFQSHLGPPEYRKWRRIHGLQLPLHPQQVAGWIIILGVGAATFMVLLPALRPFFRDCLFTILGFLFVVHILSHLTALLLDPADPELRALKIKLCVPEFDRSKHAHVIENGRCHLCNIKTSSSKTKHCSICNKCIDHFDHHCKWLNHCIGGRNYVAFLICIISAVVASLVVVAVSVLEIVYYHVDPQLLTVFPNYQNSTVSEMFLPESVFLGIVTILGLLAATSAGLLLHLCLFHCYISALGISTYEYIKNYRQEGNAQNEVPFTCNHRRKELSNNIESGHAARGRNWTNLKNCFYYSCSRSREKKESSFKCCLSEFSFLKSKSCLKRKKTNQRKILKRQNTDPEFVDRTVKPFFISLNDDSITDSVKVEVDSRSSNSRIISENKFLKCLLCKGVSVSDNEKNNTEIESKGDKRKKAQLYSCEIVRSWWPKISRKQSKENAEINVKIKSNQICPTDEEKLNERIEKVSPIKVEYYPQNLDPQYITIMRTKVLPELSEILKKRNSVGSEEIDLQLDNTDDLESALSLQLNLKSNSRKIRKKIMKRPRSPVLSPIRESGLSNPGSPRIDLILPPSPVFVRPPTPESSVIFLSNPASPSSSSSDEDEIITPPIPTVDRQYTGNILQTPQLPRKVFSTPKEEQIFVLKPPKMKTFKWIDMELRNGS